MTVLFAAVRPESRVAQLPNLPGPPANLIRSGKGAHGRCHFRVRKRHVHPKALVKMRLAFSPVVVAPDARP